MARRLITNDEYRRILDAAEMPEQLMFRVLWETGMRSCEMVALRPDSLTSVGGWPHLRTPCAKRRYRCHCGRKMRADYRRRVARCAWCKSERWMEEREVPVSQSLADALRSWCQAHGELWPFSCTSAFRKRRLLVCGRAGVDADSHSFRHTWASRLAPVMPPAILASMGGWTNLDTMFRIYYHQNPLVALEHYKRAMEAL